MEIVSVIVPCYNEQEALPYFIREIQNVANGLGQEYDFEILFVNDGSKDKTLTLLRQYAKEDSRVRYLSFSRNFGKEAAMYTGFCHASGDYVAVMDADMQDPPSLLPEMLRLIQSGEYDSVATRRVDRVGEPPIRSWFAKKFYQIMSRISNTDMADGARDFRLMTRPMVDAIVSMGERNRFSKGIFGWIGFRTYWLPYENVERVAGETKWNFWKLLKYAIYGMICFSEFPLSIASWSGIVMTGASFLIMCYIIIRRLVVGDPVQGWASLACLIIFIGGVQLFCLGIMGQYIAKTYIETKKRPIYIISESNVSKTLHII